MALIRTLRRDRGRDQADQAGQPLKSGMMGLSGSQGALRHLGRVSGRVNNVFVCRLRETLTDLLFRANICFSGIRRCCNSCSRICQICSLDCKCVFLHSPLRGSITTASAPPQPPPGSSFHLLFLLRCHNSPSPPATALYFTLFYFTDALSQPVAKQVTRAIKEQHSSRHTQGISARIAIATSGATARAWSVPGQRTALIAPF